MENKGFYWIGLVIFIFVAVLGGAAYYKNRSIGDAPVPTIAVTESDHVFGSGPVVLMEYGDFQCPACGAYFPILEQLLRDNGQDITFVFRHFPLPQHGNALYAGRAAEAAGKQGKFFEMYRKLYEHQNDWSENYDAKKIFDKYAGELSLDMTKFNQDYDSTDAKSVIQADYKSGLNLDVNSTPTFFVNGTKIPAANNPRSIEEFKTLIAAAKAEAASSVNVSTTTLK